MSQIHLARVLGVLPPSSFQRIQNDWLINSIEPSYDVFDGLASGTTSNAPRNRIPAEVDQFVAHKAGTNCITIDNNGGRFLISGGADASIHLWDLEASGVGHAQQPAASLSRSSRGSHTHAITALFMYPFDPVPSTLVTASYDKSVKLVSITPTSLEPVHNFPLDYAPYTVALSQLSSAHPLTAIGTAHPATRLIDLRSGLGTHSLPGHSGSVYSLSWSPKYDCVLASGATDGRVLFFDIRRANAAFGSLDMDDALGVIGGDSHFGAGARGALDWNTRAHNGPVTGVQWTADGDKIVTGGHDQRIRVWDAATGKNDLVHFGPRLRNERVGPLVPLISPHGYARPGRELLFWPNDDGKGDIYVHSLREGNLLNILSTPGVQRSNLQQGKKDSIGKLTSGGRINGLVWRTRAGSGQGLELYSAHGDGKIYRWAPPDLEDGVDSQEGSNESTRQIAKQEQVKKRKRDLVGDLVAGLSNKSLRV
jgi:DNA excision repair protein ERCC-8